eukprot:746904-Hanusia_phi.AAC.5
MCERAESIGGGGQGRHQEGEGGRKLCHKDSKLYCCLGFVHKAVDDGGENEEEERDAENNQDDDDDRDASEERFFSALVPRHAFPQPTPRSHHCHELFLRDRTILVLVKLCVERENISDRPDFFRHLPLKILDTKRGSIESEEEINLMGTKMLISSPHPRSADGFSHFLNL